MYKMKMSNLHIANIIAIALVLTTVIIAVMPVSADEVSVIRDLPDNPVYPEDEIEISLTQSGFYSFGEGEEIGKVTEQLPEGFMCMGVVGGVILGRYPDPDLPNTLTIEFRMETTVTYTVKTGTAEQIKTAVFSGAWTTVDSQLNTINGNVTGDTTLTLAEGTKPTPTPTPTPTSGNGGGNGGGGNGVPPTPPAGTSPYLNLAANPVDITADGSSTSVITASVWDGDEWVLENLTVNFSTSLGSITLSAVIVNGTAMAILTAGMEEGVATITAAANLSGDIGTVTNTTTVNFTTPGVTPTPAVNVTLTPTPTVTVSPTPTVTASPSPSPTKKPLIPGFEAVFAIASLLAVAYLVMQRRRKA